jgi:hypothetical protein
MITRFDPNKNKKTVEDWGILAWETANSKNLQWNVVGGLVLGVFSFSTGAGAITSLLIAGYFFWDSWKQTADLERNQAAIVEYGCIAQVLEGDSFQDYLEQFGAIAIKEELDFAAKRGLSMSRSALDFMADQPKSLPEKVIDIEAITTSSTVTGCDTYKPGDKDLIKEITERITNTLFIGLMGSGKGILISNCLRALKQSHPDLKVFVIDPKADDKELGYFEGVADKITRFKCEGQADETIVRWLTESFEEYEKFTECNKNTLLFLDEGFAVGGACERMNNGIIQTKILGFSLADSTGKHIWIASTSPFVNGLGIKLSGSSQLTTIALVAESNIGILKQWSRSSLIEKISKEDLQNLIKQSQIGRAIYLGKNNSWYPMQKLTNYSNYDRDTMTNLNMDKQKSVSDANEDAIKQLNKIYYDSSDVGINENAILILDWLKNNRTNQWIKYRGKENRDMNFIKFLSLKNISSELRDIAINQLIINQLIDVSEDKNQIKYKEV